MDLRGSVLGLTGAFEVLLCGGGGVECVSVFALGGFLAFAWAGFNFEELGVLGFRALRAAVIRQMIA